MIPCPECGALRQATVMKRHQGSSPCRERREQKDAEGRGFRLVGNSVASKLIKASGLETVWIWYGRDRALWAHRGAVRVASLVWADTAFLAAPFEQGRLIPIPLPTIKRWLADMAADPTMPERVAAMDDVEFWEMMTAGMDLHGD